ncbi:MAG: hypothetical protein GY863_02195, partial [bacterium]|nr:hypothetical protein [bacterium]
MAYIVSHDLKTPLVNIKGFAEELNLAINEINSAINPVFPLLDEKKKQAFTAAFNEDIPEALEFINSSVTNMDSLITSILKLSRLGRKELTLEKIDMTALARHSLINLAHQIEERQVKTTIGSLPQVIADRISMEQILGNILTNAVLYLDSGRTGEIEITGESTPDEAVFHVRDNGRGIKKEDM